MATRTAAAVMSTALVMALCPASAFAAPPLGVASAGGLETQASTKTIYVISSVKTKTTYDLGLLGTAEASTTASYEYNSKGMVGSHANKVGSASTETVLAYSGGKLKSASTTGSGAVTSVSYAYGADGRISKATTANTAAAGGVVGATSGTIMPTYKSGKIVKLVSTDKATANGQSTNSTVTTKYSYKSGRVSKVASSLGVTRSYAYDANGNVSKVGSVKYKNTYSKGRLSKTTFSSNGAKTVRTYKYKAVKVPASAVEDAEAQQWAIANENLNFAFGIGATY
ncbi:MAG: hypothetical protein IJ087_13970 [Eggerthellaceae bacterium]|nr:hypothetical protein [Eggerthellaceae bacterium]